MRVVFLSILCSVFLLSCQNDTKKQEEGKAIASKMETAEKYQMKVLQSSNDDFTLVCLNRFTGDVFVRNSNGSWYNAQDKSQALKKYDHAVYSIDITKKADGAFQIILFNNKNGNVYIRSYSSAWYEASGIRALENN